jgi:hypothetical protein
VSSRAAEKERRRAEREQREREMASAERRARWPSLVVATVLGMGALTAVVLAVVGFGTGGDSGGPSMSANDPFGPHYAGLEARRTAAGVPTMMQTMNSRVHVHPLLAVYVDGRRVGVPANIGIDPQRDSMEMAGLHTHDPSGKIHVEGVGGATLGQFFAIWGVPLSPSRLGPYRAGGSKTVRMWVDGKPSRAFGALRLADRQRIVISYGRRDAPPPAPAQS